MIFSPRAVLVVCVFLLPTVSAQAATIDPATTAAPPPPPPPPPPGTPPPLPAIQTLQIKLWLYETGLFSIAQFDPANGVLTSVRVAGNASASIVAPNPGPDSTRVDEVSVLLEFGGFSASALSTVTKTCGTIADDLSYTCTSEGSSSVSDNFLATLSNPTDLARFTGTGTIDGLFSSSTTGSGLLAGAGINVRYTYDTSMSAVPLPAGLPLLLAGLGGFALLRRKKSA